MYLGQSSIFDFVVCAGLGVAGVSCALAAAFAVRETATVFRTPLGGSALRLLAFMLFGGALLSIAAVLGETKPVRDPNSILGLAIGALLALPFLLAAFRKRN